MIKQDFFSVLTVKRNPSIGERSDSESKWGRFSVSGRKMDLILYYLPSKCKRGNIMGEKNRSQISREADLRTDQLKAPPAATEDLWNVPNFSP